MGIHTALPGWASDREMDGWVGAVRTSVVSRYKGQWSRNFGTAILSVLKAITCCSVLLCPALFGPEHMTTAGLC